MLNELAKEIHKNSILHGWWKSERPFSEVVALCHSELSEALEEARAGRPMLWFECDAPHGEAIRCSKFADGMCHDGWQCVYRNRKPEGIAVELVDCVIRILDYLAHENVDVDSIMRLKIDYNKTRPYMHGGKKF